jgi:hypothetical protein
MQKRAPLVIAIVFLLLPVLYVCSYLTLVVPEGYFVPPAYNEFVQYRCGKVWKVIFSPLEKLDRRLRPDAWDWRRALQASKRRYHELGHP